MLAFPHIWIPRRNILPLVFFMAHLKRGSSGHLLKTGNGHLSTSCATGPSCTCSPAPYLCLKIDGYADGDIPADPAATDNVSYPTWGGTFYHYVTLGGQCEWTAFNAPNPSDLAMDGKILSTALIRMALSSPCTYRLFIQCDSSPVIEFVGDATSPDLGDGGEGTYTGGYGAGGSFSVPDYSGATPGALEIVPC